MYLKSRVMDEKLSNMTQRSSFPTPIIPPILVRSVTGVICQSDVVCSTMLSKATDIPYKSFSSTTPVASTLYLQNKMKCCVWFTLILIDWLPYWLARYQTVTYWCKSLHNIVYNYFCIIIYFPLLQIGDRVQNSWYSALKSLLVGGWAGGCHIWL